MHAYTTPPAPLSRSARVDLVFFSLLKRGLVHGESVAQSCQKLSLKTRGTLIAATLLLRISDAPAAGRRAQSSVQRSRPSRQVHTQAAAAEVEVAAAALCPAPTAPRVV